MKKFLKYYWNGELSPQQEVEAFKVKVRRYKVSADITEQISLEKHDTLSSERLQFIKLFNRLLLIIWFPSVAIVLYFHIWEKTSPPCLFYSLAGLPIGLLTFNYLKYMSEIKG